MASTTIASFIDKIGFKVDEQSVKDVNSTAKSLKSSLTKILGTIGIAFSLTQMNAIIESYNSINKQIASAVDGLADAAETQDAILEAANECRVAYSDMANSVSDLVAANSDLFSVDDAVTYAKTITQIGKNAGASDSEISSLLSSMKSSFANGKVSSSTISTMLSTMPEAAEILAESLGTTTQKLTTLASQGRISCKELRDAFLSASDAVNESFQNTNMTISEAITVVKNKWSDFLVEFNDTYEITNRIAKVIIRLSDSVMSALNAISTRISWLSEKLGGVENLVILVTAAVGALVVAFKWDAIVKGISSVTKILNPMTLKILAIAAVFLALFYVVQDFVTFMKGGKSVIGDFFESAGIDCDKLRENLQNIWEKFKEILSIVGNSAWKVFSSFLQGVWEGLKQIGDIIGNFLSSLAPGFSDFIDNLANGTVDTAQWESFGEILGTIASVILAVVAASKIWAAVQAVVNAVASANPIILIITAIIAAIVLLITYWDEIKEAITKVWNTIKNFFGGIGNWFKDKWDAIKDGATNAWNKVKEGASNAWSGIKNAFGNVKSWFKDKWDSVKEGASSLWDSLTDGAGLSWEGIKNAFMNIKETTKSIWDSIIEGLKNVPILGTIIEAFQDAIDWITALPENALQWGKDIIQGLIDGIQERFSGITDAVSGIADTIKGFLGFSEPEEGPLSDFHTYMPDMMDSLASGIEEGRSKVKEALEMVTGDMSAVVQAGTVSATTAGAATASSTSKTIIQYNSFNNEFNGDVAGQQKSATAMSSATDDTVSALSRAMAIG